MKQLDILDRVLSLEQLPIRPETAAHLLAFHDELADGFRLRRLLAADPGLLLFAARLSEAHASRRVPTVDELAYVARTARFWTSLAERIQVARPDRSGQLPLVAAWRFGLATASAARALTHQEGHERSARAFTAGWYRAIGAYVFALLEAERWEELRSQALSFEHLIELEREVFGLSQHELAIHLLVHWGLSVEPLVELRQPANGNGHGHHVSLAQVTADAIRLVQETPLALCAEPLPTGAERLQELAWLERAVAQVEQFLAEPRRARAGSHADWLLRGARLAANAVAHQCASAWQDRLAAAAGAAPEEFPNAVARAVADALRRACSADVICAVSLPREGRTCVAAAGAVDPVRTYQIQSVVDNHSRLRAVLASLPCDPAEHGWIERVLVHLPQCITLVLIGGRAGSGLSLLTDALEEAKQLVVSAAERYHREKERREALCDLHELQAAMHRVVEERVLEAIGEFAAGAAHELNNRVAVIRGRAQLLLGESDEQKRIQSLETILRETRRVREILQKLYDLADPAEPEYERVRPEEVVDQAVARLSRELGAEHRVEVEPGDEGLLVQADPEMLREAIYELIRNAVEAGQGPVRVSIRSTARNAVVVRITDHGAGMDHRLQRLAWVPFFSGRDAGRGVGLGLPLARRLIQAQGGRLRLYSSAAGTVVDIVLPMPPVPNQGKRCA